MSKEDMDWDKPDEEVEETEYGSEEEVANFEDVQEAAILPDDDDDNGDDVEEDDDEGEVKLARPPSESEALRMMRTFNSIYETSEALAATMNVVVSDARKMMALTEKSNVDVEKIVENYNTAVLKINKQLAATQKYFETNKNIAKELSFMKEELREEFKDLNSAIESAQNKYIENIATSTESLSLKLSDFSRSMDFSAFEKTVKIEIEKVIKSSSIDRVQDAFDKVDKSFFLLEESVTTLVGADKKKGLLEEFREEVFTLDEKIKKIKARSGFWTFVGALFLGASLGGGYVWASLSLDYEKRLSLALAEHTVKVNEAWVEESEALRSAHKGYESFTKRFSIDKKYGFGYFEDTKKPYFYYDAAVEPFQFKDQMIVEIR